MTTADQPSQEVADTAAHIPRVIGALRALDLEETEPAATYSAVRVTTAEGAAELAESAAGLAGPA